MEHGPSSTVSPIGLPSASPIAEERLFGSPSSPKTITKEELLDRAKATVADRGLNYGKPEDNFVRIARYWKVHLQNRYGEVYDIDAVDVALMMNLMKVARLDNEPRHLDSWIDMAGYAACGANIIAPAPKAAETPVDTPRKWVSGIEYELIPFKGWLATGNHLGSMTDTPARGTPLETSWRNE